MLLTLNPAKIEIKYSALLESVFFAESFNVSMHEIAHMMGATG